MRVSLGLVLGILASARPPQAEKPPEGAPNIVVILADDLGYGDVQAYNPQRGKIPTPQIDRLASRGLMFTDGHSSSGVCSPSRYTLLTGRYHWRTRLQSGIVGVFGPPLIAPGRLTLAGLLRRQGYHTACVGKWHLGWDWPAGPGQAGLLQAKKGKDGGGPTEEQKSAWREIFSRPIGGGPTAHGFDEYFGTDVPNWPPYCFIENDRTAGIPSEFLPPELLKNHQASLQGPALPGWSLDRVLPSLVDRACDVVKRGAARGKPFFLYLPLTSPHTPLAVTEPWKGRSGLVPYADWVMETDAAVGRVLEALEQSGAADRTLVVFTSDNGCAPYVGAPEMEQKGHFPSGPFRGYKADAWEGGHRIPFIVRWPGVVKPGSRCDRPVGHVDLMATFAAILGVRLPDDAGEDSVSLLPLLKGEDRPVHEALVHHSANGRFALRSGDWKIILGPGSGGGFVARNTDAAALKRGDPPLQLYNLAADPGERDNLQGKETETVDRMARLLEKLVAEGRSTPGAVQKNDVPVDVRKKGGPGRDSP
jgi:arylsulfatase A-like enzyme